MGEEEQAPIPSNSDQNDGTTQVAEITTQGPTSSPNQLNENSTPEGSLGICPKCKDRPAEVSLFAAHRRNAVAALFFFFLIISIAYPSPLYDHSAVYCPQKLYKLFPLLRIPSIQ
jgi:hypothetical protein